jgi:hypothetical protein
VSSRCSTGSRPTVVCVRRAEYVWCLLLHLTVSFFVAHGQALTGYAESEQDWTYRPVWWRSEARRSIQRIDEFLENVS